MRSSRGFVRAVEKLPERVREPDRYPHTIPAIRALRRLRLDPRATFLIGENGCGKSTLIEAIAIAAGLNPEGGSKNFAFETMASHSDLHQALRLIRGPARERDGFFLRAESLFNVATEMEVNLLDAGGRPLRYGDRSLHQQSHGEAFLALLQHRFGTRGLYILDEPEAALSPTRQLAMLGLMHDLAVAGSQFVVATHSPILMAFPEATLYLLDEGGIRRVGYEETEHYQVISGFLADRHEYLRHLLS
ncbi:MAG: AAA family ATPase [Candidatus Dormibacteraeota bacterium]|nr:AAA family ATPase [Candidatus Dormibacteraeota bacterium]